MEDYKRLLLEVKDFQNKCSSVSINWDDVENLRRIIIERYEVEKKVLDSFGSVNKDILEEFKRKFIIEEEDKDYFIKESLFTKEQLDNLTSLFIEIYEIENKIIGNKG